MASLNRRRSVHHRASVASSARPLLLLLLTLLLGPVSVSAWRPPAPAPARRPQTQHQLQQHQKQQGRPSLLRLVRRAAMLGALCLPSAALGFPGLEDCISESNPSFTVVTCDKHIGIENGRPKRCQASENCWSTSSVQSASKYASPWVYNTNDVNEAFLQLVKAVENEGSLKIVEIDNESHYLRAEAPSKVPPGSVDDLEFILAPEDSLAFFRTASRQSVFVYPVQQPLSDGGTLKKRLDTIQKGLKWDSVADLYQY